MKIKIRDWDANFERDRTRQWKNLQWVPIPNKQGPGYRMIMSEKNGLEIFACWIALVQQGSLCSTRGDLSKYNITQLSLMTMIDASKLKASIDYLSQVLDWIEVIEDFDNHVKNLDSHGMPNSFGSSVLFNSIQSNSVQSKSNVRAKKPKTPLDAAMDDFEDHRKKIKKPLTKKAKELILKKAIKLGGDEIGAIKHIEHAIESGWQGIFPIKQNGQKTSKFGRQEVSDEEVKNMMQWGMENLDDA